MDNRCSGGRVRKDSPTGVRISHSLDVVGVDLENGGETTVKKLRQMKFFDQLRTLDPRDVGRWPLAVRASSLRSFLPYSRLSDGTCSSGTTTVPFCRKRKARRAGSAQPIRKQTAARRNLDAYKISFRKWNAASRHAAAITGKTEVPNLLVDISQTGLAAGLQEKLFQPAARRQTAFTPSCHQNQACGTYHDFGNFVSGIAALPRIVHAARYPDHAWMPRRLR